MIFYSLLTGNVVLNIILNLTRYQEDFFYHAGRKKKKKQEKVKTAFSLNSKCMAFHLLTKTQITTPATDDIRKAIKTTGHVPNTALNTMLHFLTVPE